MCVCVLQSYEYYTLRVTVSKQIRLCGEGNCNNNNNKHTDATLFAHAVFFFSFFFLGHHDYEVGRNMSLPTGYRGNILTSDVWQIDLKGKL